MSDTDSLVYALAIDIIYNAKVSPTNEMLQPKKTKVRLY